MLYVLNILLIKTKLCTSYYILQHLLRNYMSNVKVLIIQLYLTLCAPTACMGCSVHEDFPGKNTGVGCHALLQGLVHELSLSERYHCRISSLRVE